MTRASARPAANSSARGVLWGLLAAAIWASYTVLARLAVKAGLSPGDLTLLRFAPGALPMAPLMWRWGLRALAGIGSRRGLLLTLLAGPGFSLLFMTGFSLAPLAHGAASLLAIPVLGEVPSVLQVLGIVAVIIGLLLAFGATQLWVRRGASDHDQALGPREGTAGRARPR